MNTFSCNSKFACLFAEKWCRLYTPVHTTITYSLHFQWAYRWPPQGHKQSRNHREQKLFWAVPIVRAHLTPDSWMLSGPLSVQTWLRKTSWWEIIKFIQSTVLINCIYRTLHFYLGLILYIYNEHCVMFIRFDNILKMNAYLLGMKQLLVSQ